jgi:hypothetical protein
VRFSVRRFMEPAKAGALFFQSAQIFIAVFQQHVFCDAWATGESAEWPQKP